MLLIDFDIFAKYFEAGHLVFAVSGMGHCN